ncbi:MAG: hypothetical protein HY319_32025 [Armatimonadetes bacterium]|nr:hypothetical protein [Armatimonadota bacterium]
MIRCRCEDCGSWFRGDRPFCPDCGTLGTGGARVAEGDSYYAHGWRRLAERFQLPWSWWTLIRSFGWIAALLHEALSLLMSRTRWVPVLLSAPPSFSRIDPAEVHGVDRKRLAHNQALLAELGFERCCTYLIPEEGELSLYDLHGRPGEATWALLRIPYPSRVDADLWWLGYHSLLPDGGRLVTQSFEEPSAEETDSIRILCAQGGPRELFTAHRQAVFHAGGARKCRGLPRNGAFFRHHGRWLTGRIQGQLKNGELRRGRGGAYRFSCYRHPWAQALRSCSQCRLPVCDTCLVPFSGGALCRECAVDSPPGTGGRPQVLGGRGILADMLDRGLEAVLAGGAAGLLGGPGWVLPLLLLWPAFHWAHELLAGGRTAGRRTVGIVLETDDGAEPLAWDWTVRTCLWWVGACVAGLGFAPLLLGRLALHDAGAGVRPRTAR